MKNILIALFILVLSVSSSYAGLKATSTNNPNVSNATGTLPVANGGTGTPTAFTQGSIVFAGTAGTYSQNNANLFWDNTNNRLGIGSATPTANIDAFSADASTSDALVNVRSYQLLNPPTASTGSHSGVFSSVQFNSPSDNSGSINGVKAVAEDFGAGAANQLSGVWGVAQSDSASVYNASASLYGIRADAIVAAGGTFNHAFAAKFDGTTVGAGATLTDGGGIYIENTNSGNLGTITQQQAIEIEGNNTNPDLLNKICFGNGSSACNANFYSPTTNALIFNGSAGVSIGTTTLISGALTVSNTISSGASTALSFDAGGFKQAQVPVVGDGTNYWSLAGSSSGSRPSLTVTGSDGTISPTIACRGTACNLAFNTNGASGTTQMTIGSTGVGIGTATPRNSSTLDVNGTVNVNSVGSAATTPACYSTTSGGILSLCTGTPFTTAGTGLSNTGATVNSNAVYQISFQPGLVASVTNTKSVYAKLSKASTVDNIEGAASAFSCVSNPTVTFFECGTSTTCASTPTTIGTVTITAAGQVFDGTVSSSAITSGDYIAWAITSGTCTSLDISVTSQVHSN